jgi:Asp/Glu/hydantoin racemase
VRIHTGEEGYTMKIWCQLPIKQPRSDPKFSDYYDNLERHYNLVKRVDTEIEIGDVPTCVKPEWQRYSGFRVFNDVEILKSILAAEKEGFDGVSISCFLDPVLNEARQLLKIPVTGLAESSLHFACMMGAKFAILTRDVVYVPVIEQLIARYGVESRAIKRNPVRALTLPSEKRLKAEQEILKGISGEYISLLVENFKEVATGCIEDGAEVLIMGCGLVSPALMEAGLVEVDGVAIVEPVHASLKLTELLVDLYKAKIPVVSRKFLYLASSQEDISELLASTGR